MKNYSPILDTLLLGLRMVLVMLHVTINKEQGGLGIS